MSRGPGRFVVCAKEWGVCILLLLIAVCIFTWPLALHLSEAIPRGSEPESVAYFQLFSAQWSGKAWETGMRYWDAPFFHPYRGVFAWCEPQPLFCAGVWVLSKGAGSVAAYNAVLIAYMVLLGAAGYAGVRFFTGDRTAAFLSALWLSCGAYCMQQLCAPALIAACFPAAALVFLLFYARSGRRLLLIGAFVCMLASWFSCKQLALYLTFLAPVTVAFFPPAGRRMRPVWGVLLALTGAFACVGEMLLRQQESIAVMGFSRSVEEIGGWPGLSSLFVPAQGHWLIKGRGYSWSIGAVPFLITGVSAFVGLSRRARISGLKLRALAGLGAMGLFALLLGLGPRLVVYPVLLRYLPGMDQIRAPARAVFFAGFCVALLFGWGLAFLRSRLNGGIRRCVLTGLVLCALVAEMWAAPVPLAWPLEQLRRHQGLIDWLRVHEPEAAVLELPMQRSKTPQAVILDAGALLRMLRHGHPLVNGYASYFPVSFLQLRSALEDDPQDKGLRFLKACGARLLVVHLQADTPAWMRELPLAAGMHEVFRDSAHSVVRIEDVFPAQAPERSFPAEPSFPAGAPVAGRLYALRLRKPLSEPALLQAGQDSMLTCRFFAPQGPIAAPFQVRGGILADRAQERLAFTVLRLPRGKRPGALRLEPLEE